MKTNRRSISQRARRDAEAEMREPAPQLPAHGTRAGGGTLDLLGVTVTVELRHTGHHSRSYGLWLNGEYVGVVGKDAAMRELSRRLPSPISIRHCSC